MKGIGFDIEQINISKYMASDKLFGMLDLLGYESFIKNFNLNINTEKLSLITEKITGQKLLVLWIIFIFIAQSSVTKFIIINYQMD